ADSEHVLFSTESHRSEIVGQRIGTVVSSRDATLEFRDLLENAAPEGIAVDRHSSECWRINHPTKQKTLVSAPEEAQHVCVPHGRNAQQGRCRAGVEAPAEYRV